MTSWMWSATRALVIGGLGTAVLCQSIEVGAQETVEPRAAPVQPSTVEPGTTEGGQTIQTPRTEQAIVEQQRRVADAERLAGQLRRQKAVVKRARVVQREIAKGKFVD